MTRKSLVGVVLLVGAAVIVAGICSPIQAEPKTGKGAESLEDLQRQADNWQLKTAALDALITFEGNARTRFRGYCELLTAYIEKIGKTNEYRSADIKVTVTPAGVLQAAGKATEVKALKVSVPDKPITFEQAFGLAIEVTKARGHVVLNVADAAETAIARRVYVAKETLARKVWSDTQMFYKKALSMKVYLESIEQFEKCKTWAADKAVRDHKDRKAEMNRKRDAHLAKWETDKRAAGVRRLKAEARRLKEEEEQRKRNHEITLKTIDAQTKVLSEKYKAAGYWAANAYRCCDNHNDYNHHH